MRGIRMRKARVLRGIAARSHVGASVALVVHHFTISAMEHMVGRFAAFCNLIFLFELSSHFVIFEIFCKVASVFAATQHSTVSFGFSPSSSFAATMGSSSPTPATRSLIEASVLLVWQWPRKTLLY